MKIIGKISICFAILSYIMLMICSIVTSTYAWQTTNGAINRNTMLGDTSYAIAPNSYIYFTYPRSTTPSDGYTSKSYGFQNAYNINTKKNFEIGRPLTGAITETLNDWNEIQFENSPINDRDTELKRLYGYTGSVIGDLTYVGTEEAQFGNKTTKQGSVYDKFTYDIHANLYKDNYRMSAEIAYDDFYITMAMLSNETTQEAIQVLCGLTAKDDKGGIVAGRNNYTISFITEQYDKNNKLIRKEVSLYKETGTSEGYYYDKYDQEVPGQTYIILPFQHILEAIQQGGVQSSIVKVSNLKITIGEPKSYFYWTPGTENNNFAKIKMQKVFYRPYATSYKIASDTSEYPITEGDSLKLFDINYRNEKEFSTVKVIADLDGFDILGESVGSTVDGIFKVEIFPNVTLWTILLIPLSLGILFAVLRYFAGG